MDEQLVLVGNAAGGSITAYRITGDRLIEAATSEVGVGCSTFVLVGDLVFIATKAPAIVVAQLDRNSGSLTVLGHKPIPAPLAYLSATPDEKMLLGASYHAGWASVWPLEGSTIGDPKNQIALRNLHSIIASPDGRFAYAASLGDDVVAVCEVTDAGLCAVQEAPAPEGSGPRHLLLSPDAESLYLLTEFTGEAIRYHRDPQHGTLTLAETVLGHDPAHGLSRSQYGADPLAERLIWGADLHLAGGWLLCSERTSSTITAVAVDSEGRLGAPGAVSEVEDQPRGFTVSPSGEHVVVAGERSGQVGLYRLDAATGALHRLGSAASGKGPNWVRFA